MAQNNAERPSSGRTALGGAACGFTYDAAMQDVVAREGRLRRPLRLKRWQDRARNPPPPTTDARREQFEPARAAPSPTN